MNAPDQIPYLTGDANNPNSGYFPLTEEQVIRGRGMNLSDERIRDIQKRMVESQVFLGKIKASRHSFDLLLSMTQGDYLKKIDLPEDMGLADRIAALDSNTVIESLKQLTQELFTGSTLNQGIPYIAAYYTGSDHKIRYLYMIALLHFWHTLGSDHRAFGRIPTQEEYLNDKGSPNNERIFDRMRNTWGYYTGYKKNGEHHFGALVDGERGIGRLEMPRSIDARELPRVFSSLGDIEPKGLEKAPESDIEYLEELYVLFGPTDSTPPHRRVLFAFLKKHATYFLEDIDGRCAWEEGKRHLIDLHGKKVKATTIPAATPKKQGWNRRKGATPHNGPSPYATLLGAVSVAGIQDHEEITEVRFLNPIIAGGFGNKLRSNSHYSGNVEYIAEKMNPEHVLWIGYGNPFSWYRKKYGSTIDITLLGETTFAFCYSEDTWEGAEPPEDVIQHPRTRITITPRPAPTPDKPKSDTVGGTIREKVGDLVESADRGTTEVRVDMTDAIGLEILDILDNRPEDLTISMDGGLHIVRGVFGTDPTISYEITENDIIFGPRDVVGVNISGLQGALASSFPHMRKVITSQRDTLFLARLSGARTRISKIFRSINPDDQNDGELKVSDLLKNSRIDNTRDPRYGGDIFKNPIHIGKFKALQDILKENNILIELGESGGSTGINMSLKVSIRGVPNSHYIVAFRRDEPCYHISHYGEEFPVAIDTYMRDLSLDIYTTISLLGRAIFETTITSDEYVRYHRGYSLDTIEKIISGTYKSSERTVPPPYKDNYRSVYHAAKRVEDGELKVSRGQKSISALDISLKSISTVQDIREFHLLDEDDEIVVVDAKILCLNNQQDVERRQNWEKKRGEKHPYHKYYNLLRHDERTKKYMIRRMIATIPGSADKSLAPLDNRLSEVFLELYHALALDKQREFINAIKGKHGSAWKGLGVMYDEKKTIYAEFIDRADTAGVPIWYNAPKTMSKAEILAYIQSEDYIKWKVELEKEKPELAGIIGK